MQGVDQAPTPCLVDIGLLHVPKNLGGIYYERPQLSVVVVVVSDENTEAESRLLQVTEMIRDSSRRGAQQPAFRTHTHPFSPSIEDGRSEGNHEAAVATYLHTSLFTVGDNM